MKIPKALVSLAAMMGMCAGLAVTQPILPDVSSQTPIVLKQSIQVPADLMAGKVAEAQPLYHGSHGSHSSHSSHYSHYSARQ